MLEELSRRNDANTMTEADEKLLAILNKVADRHCQRCGNTRHTSVDCPTYVRLVQQAKKNNLY